MTNAEDLHTGAIVVDAHSDVFCDVADRRLRGETDVLRRLHVPAWREGGVNVVVTTLYVEPQHKPDRALLRAVTMVGAALNDIEQCDDVRLCKSRAEVDAAVEAGKIALILAMEGGEPVQAGIESLRVFHELGVRIFGFTWNQRNLLAEGVGEERSNGGLTELGRTMVQEANRLGILLDVSHLTVKSFWDLLATSQRPVIASHSNALALCAHKRNLSDDQIQALAESGGFIGINAVAAFIDDDPNQADLDRMLDHLDHVAQLAGVGHVALGPDFVDFMELGPVPELKVDSIAYPRNFENIRQTPAVTAGLIERHYDDDDIRGILGQNFLRVFADVCG